MKMLYVFENCHLVGMQNVSTWTSRQVGRAMDALGLIGRTGDVSDRGRSICCVCKADIGPCDIPMGKLSHGYCTVHFNEAMAEVSR